MRLTNRKINDIKSFIKSPNVLTRDKEYTSHINHLNKLIVTEYERFKIAKEVSVCEIMKANYVQGMAMLAHARENVMVSRFLELERKLNIVIGVLK